MKEPAAMGWHMEKGHRFRCGILADPAVQQRRALRLPASRIFLLSAKRLRANGRYLPVAIPNVASAFCRQLEAVSYFRWTTAGTTWS